MGRSSVRVVARTRPTDHFANDILRLTDDNKGVHVHIPKRSGNDIINNAVEDHAFKLDWILKDASQEAVFETCGQDLVKSVLLGYNGTIMCYGQTGAGKTYTMMGGSDYRTRGIVPRIVKAVFDEASSQPDKTFEIRVSCMEIYNERIRDLLDPSSVEDFAVQEDAKGNIYIRGLQMKSCVQEAEALAHLFEANSNCAVAGHSLNPVSSRSHVVFTIHVTSRSRVESESASLVSKLHCIDLAGSERLSKTGSDGQIMKEAQFINKSLAFLEQVVIALSSTARAHVPFRQSKLTNILKDSLGGNSKTTMIANIWPEERHMEETTSTLKFATRMMRVQVEPTVNVVLDSATHIRQLQRTINELKSELQMQNQLMGKSHIVYEGEMSDDEKFELEKVVRSYIAGSVADIPVRSLREVKEYFKIFKACIEARDAEIKASFGSGSVNHPELYPTSPKPSSVVGRKPVEDPGHGVIDPASGLSVGVAAPAKALREVLAIKPPGTLPSARSNAGATNGSEAQAHSAALDDVPPALRELPEKSVAFEDFKRTDGAKYVASLRQAQQQLVSLRQSCAEVSVQVNNVKKRIDDQAADLERRHLDRQARGEEELIDDEEFNAVKSMKTLKQEYRRLYDALTSAKTERDHAAKVVDQLKQKLIGEFEAWYQDTFAAVLKTTKPESKSPAKRSVADDDDALDEGERFERLELNRVLEEDPESVAYYSAKKLTLTRPNRKAPTVSKVFR